MRFKHVASGNNVRLSSKIHLSTRLPLMVDLRFGENSHTHGIGYFVCMSVCLRAHSCHCLSTGLARLVHSTGLAEHPYHRLSAWFNQLN